MTPHSLRLQNEAAVEWHIIEPLLTKLGYAKDDVSPKHPIVFREGRRGRHPEADYAVFSCNQHGRETSLFVVEAKRPGEPGWSAKDQAESYQHALRAPFLLLVDGLTIEVWQYQPVGESELVFGPVAIADLDGHFGKLSLILSKEAAIAYCQRLRRPDVRTMAEDWSSYLNAELDRLDKHGFLVPRTLLDTESSSKLSTSTLLTSFPRGACITAPSGYGKTSLAVAIMRQALEASLAASSDCLPVLVPCDDLPLSIDLVTFVLQRISVHKPGLTRDEILRRLNAYGFTLVIDSFERLPGEWRQEIAKELRNLLRDYPRLQVFLLSRRGTLPAMGLPLLHLEPLLVQEQRELAVALLGPGNEYAWIAAPELLHSLCRIPLLLDLALAFWRKHQAWPTGLAEMFDQWLTSIVSVGVEHSASQQALRREALQQLARRHSEGPLGVDAGMAALKTAGHPAALLDELLSVDAIHAHASGITFSHDALGDYLLALEWAAEPEADLLSHIEALKVERGSLFPVLLIGITTSPAAQRAMWQRLMHGDIQSYFDALRYRADSSAILLNQGQDSFALHFLEELLDGIEQPLRAFFPDFATQVFQNLVKENGRELAIIGDAGPNAVYYELCPKIGDQPRVAVGSLSGKGTWRSINLHLSRMRSDSGRLIGTNLLRRSINDAVKVRNFIAGQALASERLLGRLRYLALQYGIKLEEGATIDDALARFEPQAGSYVCWPRPGDRRKIFLVDEIIADLRALRHSGSKLPSAWWRQDGGDEEVDLASDASILYAVDQEIRRAQIIYDEIVRLNFETVAAELPIHGSLPLRYKISIERNQKHPNDSESLWITRVSMPVADFASAGADLVPRSETVRPTYDDVAAALERLGRYPARVVARWSSGSFKRFDGTDRLGNFDGETAAMRTACNWLADDLKALFEELPER